jgi:small subunit ribosomal protein S11
VLATFNNTVVTITDMAGNRDRLVQRRKVRLQGLPQEHRVRGADGRPGRLPSAMGHGLKEVEVRVKGPGSGRESAVRAMQAVGLEISVIKDVTPVPHNGCRPPKARRV